MFGALFWAKLNQKLPAGLTADDRERAIFDLVRRWTRTVDIFAKDYLLIPMASELHWTLCIIVHPGVAATTARRAMELPDVVDVGAVDELADPMEPWPVMLRLDSIGGYHLNAEPLLRGWLAHESAHRRNRSLGVARRLFSADNMPCLRPDVPRQPDSRSCGLFVLEFARRFLLGAPETFTKAGYPYFLTRDWFPPTSASPCATTSTRLSWRWRGRRLSRRRCLM